MATHWFQIKPHTVKKGENLTSIAKAHRFPGSAALKIYKAPYNAKLRKTRPDPNLIKPGDIVNLPNFTKAELDMLWKLADGVWWHIDKLFLYQPLFDGVVATEDKITDMESEMRRLYDKFRHSGDPMQKKANECRDFMKRKSTKIGEMAKCVVEIEKWRTKQRDLDKEVSALIDEQNKALKSARGRLKALKSLLKVSGDISSKIMDTAETVKSEALKGHRNTF